MGCNREIIELMPIKDVEIVTTAINLQETPTVFAISVLVIGTLSGENCIEDYQIEHGIMPHVFDRYPIYLNTTKQMHQGTMSLV